MFKSHTKFTTPKVYFNIRSLEAHSFGLVHVHVRMFAAYRYGSVIYACILPTVFCHSS